MATVRIDNSTHRNAPAQPWPALVATAVSGIPIANRSRFRRASRALRWSATGTRWHRFQYFIGSRQMDVKCWWRLWNLT